MSDAAGPFQSLWRNLEVSVSPEPGEHLWCPEGDWETVPEHGAPAWAGEEPSSCLCSMNCHREGEPAVAGSGCNQIERT